MRAIWLNRLVILLSLAGIVIAGTLTYAKYAGIVPPCGLAQGCDKVQTDPSSLWFGQPVALYGLLAYVAILGIAVLRVFKGLENTRGLGLIGYWISLVGAMVSLGLQIYSGTVIRAWCSWCIASAITMTLVFIVQAILYQTLADSKRSIQPEDPPQGKARKADYILLGAAAVLSVFALAAAKVMTDNSSGGAKTFVVADEDVPKLVPEDVHAKGPVEAPVTIVEFGDLCCAACQKAFAQLNELYNRYEGKIRIVFRHFPLMELHPQAYRAAVYSEIAGTKGHFWEFLDRVYQIPADQMDKKETFENVLMELNVDVGEAEKQYGDPESFAYERVYRDLQMADELGIQVTPTFFVFVKGEKPKSVQMNNLMSTLENEEKFRKLLQPDGG